MLSWLTATGLRAKVAGTMEVVELNVGGRIFVTTRSTLCKHSNSMLAAMFSGDMQPALQDKQGRFFIDRNGDHFAIILAYLRDEPLKLPGFGMQRRALEAEARFYQVVHGTLLAAIMINFAPASPFQILCNSAQLQSYGQQYPALNMFYSELSAGKVVHTVYVLLSELCTEFFWENEDLLLGKTPQP